MRRMRVEIIIEGIMTKNLKNLVKTVTHRSKNFNELLAQETWRKHHQGT